MVKKLNDGGVVGNVIYPTGGWGQPPLATANAPIVIAPMRIDTSMDHCTIGSIGIASLNYPTCRVSQLRIGDATHCFADIDFYCDVAHAYSPQYANAMVDVIACHAGVRRARQGLVVIEVEGCHCWSRQVAHNATTHTVARVCFDLPNARTVGQEDGRQCVGAATVRIARDRQTGTVGANVDCDVGIARIRALLGRSGRHGIGAAQFGVGDVTDGDTRHGVWVASEAAPVVDGAIGVEVRANHGIPLADMTPVDRVGRDAVQDDDSDVPAVACGRRLLRVLPIHGVHEMPARRSRLHGAEHREERTGGRHDGTLGDGTHGAHGEGRRQRDETCDDADRCHHGSGFDDGLRRDDGWHVLDDGLDDGLDGGDDFGNGFIRHCLELVSHGVDCGIVGRRRLDVHDRQGRGDFDVIGHVQRRAVSILA